MDLFGNDDPPPPKKRRRVALVQAAEPTPYMNVVADYFKLFEAKFRVKPMFRARDGKHLKDLLASLGEEEVRRLLPLFFESRHRRIIESDYSVPVFYSTAQLLRIGTRRPQVDPVTAHNMDAAERASRPRR